MGATQLDLTLLLGAVVLLAAIVAVRFATRIGLPGLLVYLAIGLALQSIVHFDDARRAQSLGLAALVLILAEGGLTTRWDDVKPAVVPAALLSTLGVAISMSVTAVDCAPRARRKLAPRVPARRHRVVDRRGRRIFHAAQAETAGPPRWRA